MISVPAEIRAILAQLRAAGHEACPVGGCVRDSLLGLTPGDWDIATSARPEEVVACFGEAHTIPTGLKHGTVTVLWDGAKAEVTTYRSDGAYSDHRRPDGVRFVGTLEEDLRRRDFTVNAMALDARDRVIDLFGGQRDLEKGLIRCVGTAEARFREDALRILRALRFAARLGFSIEGATKAAMFSCRELLSALSAERVLSELKDFLSAPKPGWLAADFGPVLAQVLPPLTTGAIRREAPALNDPPADFALRLALLCRELTEAEAQALISSLRSDRETERRFLALGQALRASLPKERSALLPLLRQLGWADGELLAARPGNDAFKALLQEAQEERLPLRAQELPIGGEELLALGAEPGPVLGEVLEALLTSVWQGEAANRRESLLPLAEKLVRCYVDSCGAVVFRETAAGAEVLMIYHRKGWGFPKGHLQPGETEERCAEREVLEETGVRIRADGGFRRETVSERPGDRRKVIFLLGRYEGGEARPEPGETRAAAWFPAEEAAALVYYPGDREIYLAALEYYRQHR